MFNELKETAMNNPNTEYFLIMRNNEQKICSLKTLNYLINELQENILVLISAKKTINELATFTYDK